ncbi:MAG TPA: hypothetical protein VEI74_01940 [Candidatus Methylomirabilis sp.]|nr:hypothetical protein [Candidatus Methylomirabilis sp.]
MLTLNVKLLGVGVGNTALLLTGLVLLSPPPPQAEISRDAASNMEARVTRAARLKRGAIENARNVMNTSSL